MRDLVTLRDGTCTTPWCNAPVTDIDHHHPASRGGPTTLTNARGLCRWCNVTKADQTPPDEPAPDHPAPDNPPPPSCRPDSPVERRLRRHLRHHTHRAARRHGDRVAGLTAHRC